MNKGTNQLLFILQKTSETQKRILHPRDLSSGTQKSIRNPTTSRDATVRASPVPRSASPSISSSFTNVRVTRPKTPLSEETVERYNESENEDYSDAFDDRAVPRGRSNQRLELTKKLSSKSWVRSWHCSYHILLCSRSINSWETMTWMKKIPSLK